MRELKRLVDWRGRMAQFHTLAMGAKFQWGAFDCAKYAAGHIAAVTGVDLSEGAEDYDDVAGAQNALAKLGYVSLLDMAEKNLPPCGLPWVSRGDIAMIENNSEGGVGWVTAVCLGDKYGVITPAGYGFLLFTDPKIKFGFKVG